MLKVLKKSEISEARKTEIKTPHGVLSAPVFLPDATRASLKGLSFSEIAALGLPAMVVNTFHLHLQPGSKRIFEAGGVHGFMKTGIPLVSDSGGFQVFSLIHKGEGSMGKLHEDGARFKSPLDGSWQDLTPEKSIQIQFDLGTDMIVCLDDCPPNDSNEKTLDKALERTTRWAKECKVVYEEEVERREIEKSKRPLLISVIQGGLSIEKRQACARSLVEIGFDGYGYGARPVDAEGNFLEEVMLATARATPENSVRFALGVGTPDDILRSVRMGWDVFDCVIPTREGRHGRLFYLKDNESLLLESVAGFYETANIVNAKYKKEDSPINPFSVLPELRAYSKSYLHHLFKVGDPLGARLASLHNLEFFNNLMSLIRKSIDAGKL